MLKKTLLCVSVIAFAGFGIAFAQQPPAGIKRTPLQTIAFPEGYNTIVGLAELAPGVKAGRHTHPGIETGYVLDGEVVLSIDGQPDKIVKVGESYQIPAGAVHDAAVHGDKPMKVLGIYVVDKSKPLATPAPPK